MPSQFNLFEVPITVPVLKVPQPDGSILIRAGKPDLLQADDISVAEAAAILQLSVRHIEAQCSVGQFPGAYKPGGLPKSRWRIPRAQVLARRQPPAE
jgi:hypothetical protein